VVNNGCSPDDYDDETWIYIAHRHKISNALNTLVLRQKECIQHLFEGRFCIAGISDIVRQQVPNSIPAVSQECHNVTPCPWHILMIMLVLLLKLLPIGHRIQLHPCLFEAHVVSNVTMPTS